MALAGRPRHPAVHAASNLGAVVVLGAVCSLAACGDDQGGSSAAAPTPDGSTPAAATPAPGSAGSAGSGGSTSPAQGATSPSSTLSWSVAGTGPDGRSVVVAVGPGAPCDLEPEYRVIDATASTIRLEVKRVPSTCEASTGVTWPPKTIDVGRRVRGQTFEGDGRTDVAAGAYGMPRLIGLRLSDAEAILRNAQQPAPKVSGPRSGYVTKQSLDPGTLLFDTPPVSLTLAD